MIKRFLEERKQWGFKVAWYNVRFNVAFWLLGKPKSMKIGKKK